jgi:DNA-binding Lrp family transcriptional regulator
MRAYILIQNEAGTSAGVARAVAEAKGVTSADVVSGPYDVIALTEFSTLNELGRFVVSKIQAIDGVTRTLTCPVVRL